MNNRYKIKAMCSKCKTTIVMEISTIDEIAERLFKHETYNCRTLKELKERMAEEEKECPDHCYECDRCNTSPKKPIQEGVKHE